MDRARGQGAVRQQWKKKSMKKEAKGPGVIFGGGVWSGCTG